MPFDSNGVFSRVMNWTSDQQKTPSILREFHNSKIVIMQFPAKEF